MTKLGTPSGAGRAGAIVTVGFELVGVPFGSRLGGGFIGVLLADCPPLLAECPRRPCRPCATPNERFARVLPAPPALPPALPPPALPFPWPPGCTPTGPVGPVGVPVGPV